MNKRRIIKTSILYISTLLAILIIFKMSLVSNYIKLQGRNIVFPEEMICIPDDTRSPNLKAFRKPKIVIWVDSTECSSCRIGRLYEYEELYQQGCNEGFDVLVLFSPRADDFCEAQHMVRVHHFSFPVYFDVNNSFGKSNNIPSDIRFHAFLLDRDDCICFIGDPMSNLKLRNVFNDAIQSIVNER